MSAPLSNRIRVLRAEHGISQTELAEAIGVSRKTISTIEVGRFTPSTVIALKIARYFDVPVEAVFRLKYETGAGSERESSTTA
ncbi:transcriptional regulator [Marinicauda salina]|uniref:Transcriptional regulator n=1 Tax=Marinicauda salina TaxID=2135793 RepID=A0A2U2BU31_9PROT|nr:helix-turn-helix transcriptional regulator [Marinicauda salina]PWE17523.1 transcriptional regulator [Marinicauda salina]